MTQWPMKRPDLKTQVKRDLRRYIDNMDLEADHKLPSEDNLAALMGVSRVTIRAALNDLAAEGLILRRQGKGTFVNRSSVDIKVSFNAVDHFSDMITRSGYTPGVKLLGGEIRQADGETAEALQIPPGGDVLVSRRVFLADGRFCAYCRDTFDVRLAGDDPLENLERDEDSVFQLLYHRAGIQLAWDKVEIQTVCTGEIPELAGFSGVPGSLLLLTGINHDTEDRPVLICREYVNTEIIRYSQIRTRSVIYDG